MPHQHHFLSRLDRLSMPHVDLALSLYRDHGLVKFILESARLPDGASRAAISLEDDARGPFLLVSRTGVFVTCLGEGMSVRDLPIVSRERLDAFVDRAGRVRSRQEAYDALAEETGGLHGLLRRAYNAGANLSREEMSALLAMQPLLRKEFAAWLVLTVDDVVKVRERLLPEIRRTEKLRHAGELLRAYWCSVWLVANLLVLVGADGPEAPECLPSYVEEALRRTSYSWQGVRQGSAAAALRALWGAANVGTVLLPSYVERAESANTFLSYVDSFFGMTAIAARHPRCRGEVLAIVERFGGPAPEGDAMLLMREAILHLVRAVMSFDERDPTISKGVAIRIGGDMGVRIGKCVPRGSRYAFERSEDVPEDLALSLAVGARQQFLTPDASEMLTGMAALLPWVARASPEQLYLPRDYIRSVGLRYSEKEAYDMLRAMAQHYRPRRARPTGPTRSGPCPCGSQKKYKRCCAVAEA